LVVRKKSRLNKGISEFVREHGNVLADVPRDEIDRLAGLAERQGIESKNLYTAFYRLRRAAGRTRGKHNKPATVPEVATVAVPEPEVEESPRVLLQKALDTVRDIVGATLTACESMQAEILTLHHEKRALEDKLAETTSRLTSQTIGELETLALQLPQHPKVLQAVWDAKRLVAVQEEGVPKEFPNRSLYEEAQMRYREEFLVRFKGLDEGEQKQVVKALRHLSEMGPQYHGLNSKKLHVQTSHTPAGSWWSRTSQGMRFTWMREYRQVNEPAKIVLLEIIRRGDSGFSES